MQKISSSQFHQQLYAEGPTEQIVPSPDYKEYLKKNWIEIIGGQNEYDLERRLQWDGLNLQDALQRLPDTSPHRKFSKFTTDQIHDWLVNTPDLFEENAPQETIPFGEIWRIISAKSLDLLRLECPATNHLLFSETALTDLSDALTERLSELTCSTLYHEFNQSRNLRDTLLFNTSDHENTTAERTNYKIFMNHLRADGLHTIFRKYPVLEEYLCKTIFFWLESSAELLNRILENLNTLIEKFDLPQNLRLTDINQNLSDPHHGGRSVAILTFCALSDPEHPLKIVYKPRGMNMELVYQNILNRVPIPKGDSRLRSLKVIAVNDYGFIEFVERIPCKTDGELKIFYRNAGRLTAFLHLLGCTDCHFENLIAAKDQLILIDTETLLEGKIPLNQLEQTATVTATKALNERLANSAVRTGLLPYWSFWGNERVATDVSALGIEPGINLVNTVQGWLHVNTDHMFLGLMNEAVQALNPSPLPLGKTNKLADFLEDFCSGFEDQLKAFLPVKNEWCSDGGILDQFIGVKRRIVLRSTRIYHSLKMQQIEPRFLTSYLHQGLVLEQLGRAFLSFKEKPKYWSVFKDEIESMGNLDVPFFTIKCNERDLILQKTRIPDYLEKSGLELSKQKILELNQEEIAFQLKITRALIKSKKLTVNNFLKAQAENGPQIAVMSQEETLAESVRIAQLLLEEASIQQDIPFWLAVDIGADSDKLCYGVLGPSLYSGQMGIALFLNALGQQLKEEGNVYLQASRKIVTEYLHHLRSSEKQNNWRNWWRDTNFGLSGSGGLLLALTLLEQQDESLKDGIQEVVSSVLDALNETRLTEDTLLDVMSGLAGLIGPLLTLNTDRSIELAIICGDHLTNMQLASGGWRVGNGKELTGFSHGASGIIAALAKLYGITANENYRISIERGLAFERKCYNETERNWQDLRVESKEKRYAVSWCHGAPGIALSRLSLMGTTFWNETTKQEAINALKTTSELDNHNDCLCCGSAGRASILRYAAEILNDKQWELHANQIESKTFQLAKTQQHDYRCFETKEANVIKPGLFTGTSGIGMSFLESATGKTVLPTLILGGLR